MNIGDIIRAGIKAGKSNDAIIADVKKVFPEAKTSPASVAWYRSKEKKAGSASGVTKKAKTAKAPKKDTFRTSAKAPKTSLKLNRGFSARNVKTFKGMEGQGYNATIYWEDVAVAEVIDNAHGGPLTIHWFKDTEAAQAEMLLVVTATPELTFDFGTIPNSTELVIEELVNDALLARTFKMKLKHIVLLRDEKLYTIKAMPTTDNVARVMEKNPEAQCLNTLEFNAAFQLFKRHITFR